MRPLLLITAMGLAAAGCSSGAPMPPGPAHSPAVSAAECHYSLDDTTRVYAETEVEPAPRMLSAGPQEYPAELRGRGIQGWVILHFIIDASGSPVAASITADTSSEPAFVPAAAALVMGSRFQAGAFLGRAVPVCVKWRVNWETS